MTLELKSYQKNALATLEAFFEAARGATSGDAVANAFATVRTSAWGAGAPRTLYRPFNQASPEVPQVCVRIPTGGGKTLLACHAIDVAARRYVGTTAPIALWLVPSNTIRQQTLDALKKPSHPYRAALEQHYAVDRLTVIDIDDCEQLRPDDFGTRALVIVATIQTLRVGVTASRKVYAYKEAFEPHFSRLPTADFFEHVTQADLDEQPYLKPTDLGKTKFSFANLLAFYRPIVIVDEAHNATTDLSTETLARVRPACVIEWTATPAKEQNVLFTVSAQELKTEHMIKLPIVLQPHPNWQEAIRDAILTRDRLAKEAAAEADYIRPIVLLQAEPKDREVTVERLKSYLTETLHIEAHRIAIATGDQRELDGINLFDRGCPIDFVITVEALKEGWDCSFAYVFATAQTIRQAKDMEQLLGRVLRLPYAKPRRNEHLNRAYAHVSAPATIEIARQLTDRLISMGFEAFDAVAAIETAGPDLFGASASTQPAPAVVPTTIDLSKRAGEALLAAGGSAVALVETVDGYRATLSGVISRDVIEAAVAAAPRAQRAALERELTIHKALADKAASPRERGVQLTPIPRLAVPVQSELCLLEPAILGDLSNFSLAGRDAEFPQFQKDVEQAAYLVDIQNRKVNLSLETLERQLDLNVAAEGIRREDVIRSLDRKLRRHDILQPDMIAWLGRVLDGLARQGVDLTYVARHINSVSDKLAARIESLLASAQKETFQQLLLDAALKPRMEARFDFRFPNGALPARTRFAGRYQFKKHYDGPPGELDDDIDAEETACAIAIDQMPEVNVWLRNLERRGDASFALPTSTDLFYPDFIAWLNDGRILLVEYKGAHLFNSDDAREKRDIGQVWAAASNGQCRFAMITTPTAAGGNSIRDQLHAAVP